MTFRKTASTADDTSGFFSSPPPSVKFYTPGDKVRGQVIAKDLRQQTDLDTGEALTWDDSRPRMQLVVTLRIAEETDEDDGTRNLYVRANLRKAIMAGLKAVQQTDLMIGDTLTVLYTGDDTPVKRGISGAKLYAATVNGSDEPPF